MTFQDIFEDISYADTIDAMRNLIKKEVTPEQYALAYQIADNLDSNLESIMIKTEGQLIKQIREFNQMSIYTVDNHWHVMLYDLCDCANDEVDCIYEGGREVLLDALSDAWDWVTDRWGDK